MTILEMGIELKNQLLKSIHNSWLLKGLAIGVAIIVIMIIILATLLGIAILLHKFFKRHPIIKRARKILTYLLTMLGVFALLIAGILGLILPIIPGIALLLAGFLLLRKYHKYDWLENKIKQFRKRLHKIKNKSKHDRSKYNNK